MTITATTNAKWWGAPAPLFCGPKELYEFTGSWDHSIACKCFWRTILNIEFVSQGYILSRLMIPGDDQWANPPTSCDDYEGQKGGGFKNGSPSPNALGRTDVEGCCWWGRGVIQTTVRTWM